MAKEIPITKPESVYEAIARLRASNQAKQADIEKLSYALA